MFIKSINFIYIYKIKVYWNTIEDRCLGTSKLPSHEVSGYIFLSTYPIG